jgi:hypothetical protein
MPAPRTYPPHALYDNSHNPSFIPPMLAYLHWQYPPPLPIPHKVWIIDCKSCATFITNRAMKVYFHHLSLRKYFILSKAVLLLRPNVSLFSSDAFPLNCSPYTTNPDALRPPTYPLPLRTCECLTQTLCCHGCGSTIGYMIVIPVNHSFLLMSWYSSIASA